MPVRSNPASPTPKSAKPPLPRSHSPSSTILDRHASTVTGGSSSEGRSSPVDDVATTLSREELRASEALTKGGKAAQRVMELGVQKRTAMGEYVGDKVGDPLSSLALPTPGPLSYTPQLPPSGFQYSILGKHSGEQVEKHSAGPGPAVYNVEKSSKSVADNAPKWSIHGVEEGNKKVTDSTPSPFTYNDTNNMLGKDAVSYSISGWAKTWANESPGPDRYNPRPGFGDGPKYSFGLKTKIIDDETPGPLDYHAPFIKPDAPTAPTFSLRPDVGNDLFEDKETDFRPAPNTYFPKMKWGEKAATLKGHYKESKAMKTPGPANYIVAANLFNGPQFSMTGRDIPYEEENYYVPTPGPTSYSPKTGLTNDTAPAFSMQARRTSRGEKVIEKHNSPGPGSYTPRDRQVRGNDGQKATLKSRWKDRVESTPGPASYTPQTMIPPPGTFSRKPPTNLPERIKYHIEGKPGPTDYTPSITSAKPSDPRYTLGKRLKIEKADATPAPNAYKPPSTITKDGPKITMKSRMSPFVMVFPTTRVDTLRV